MSFEQTEQDFREIERDRDLPRDEDGAPAEYPPRPDFNACNNCGADVEHVYYDEADGWCCSECGSTDADS